MSDTEGDTIEVVNPSSQRRPRLKLKFAAAARGTATGSGSQPLPAPHPLPGDDPNPQSTANTDKYTTAISNIDKIYAALATSDSLNALPPLLLREVLSEAKSAFTILRQQTHQPPDLRQVLNEVRAVKHAI
ncbi:hypothetical protein CB0940_12193 [Cercospora beticola]|uniref:Uncharacterized protein n=1 Tax=Cercospora beticola TaxID=122368 RepID=A0A2G5GRQ4_CERBT|nr:hypothetical protein CB0940_12193 [Cercospora beticola]PIA82977.1 hypothetical protein CB0940_12193 [Cercospora beticola]